MAGMLIVKECEPTYGVKYQDRTIRTEEKSVEKLLFSDVQNSGDDTRASFLGQRSGSAAIITD